MYKTVRNFPLSLCTFLLFAWSVFAQTEPKAELVVQTGHFDYVLSVAFSPNGKIMASGSGDKTVKLWAVESGKQLRAMTGHEGYITAIAFSPNGKTLVSISSSREIKRWSVESGQELKSLDEHPVYINAKPASIDINAISSDGKTLAGVNNFDGTIQLWSAESGEILKTFPERTDYIRAIAFSPDGKILASSNDKIIKMWSTETGQQLKTFVGHTDPVDSITFSPDGKVLAVGGKDKTIELWSVENEKQIGNIPEHTNYIRALAFSPDGKTLAGGIEDNTIKLWSINNGRLLKTFTGHTDYVVSFVISPDGKTLASGSGDKTIKLWSIENGLLLKSFKGHTDYVYSVAFSSDGKVLASESNDKSIKLWDVVSGHELKTFSTENTNVKQEINKLSLEFEWEEYNRTAVFGNLIYKRPEADKIVIFDKQNDKELATLIALGESDWAVVTPEGLFDASPEGRKLLHYVVGLETLALDQMKDAYYVPGLLSKITKNNPLPKIELFSKKDLFPDVEFAPPKAGQKDLQIKLVNRGGGIGQVQILINGKEFISDARPANFDINAKQPVTLNVSLVNAPWISGAENKIEVVARNAAGSLTNRGTARGAQLAGATEVKSKPDPNVYAVVVGISDYTNDDLKLNFAAKDAEDFAKALELGAAKMLGDKSKVHVRLLTSSGDRANVKFNVPDAKIAQATKAHIEQAFADFKNAAPNDVFIVYLAGHGISLNLNQNPQQAGGDTYLYLTQEATTTDKSVLAIENSRKAMTVSSDEIKDLMKQNKALKQVLILDTCASGQLAQSFTAKRDLPSDQIRAIERLKDNTGFYVLMGSASDAVSYEASQYGQGLLTYSLLQGMQGARLDAGGNADVESLFSYAVETVPQMAKNIGGIQQPRTITPDESRSFPIGRFTETERSQIKLPAEKPLILNPKLQNDKLRFDNLKLTAMLREELRRISFVETRGENPPPIIYVEADELPNAVTPSGGYIVDGENLTITLVLVRNNEPFGKEISATGKVSEKETLVKRLVAEIVKAAK